MKKELQAQLDGLLSLGLTENSPEYLKLEAAMQVANQVPESEWNNPELLQVMQEAGS
jgi:hypothetical protein